jgi:peptide/nickel transport system substrate-binding protein
MTTVISGSTNQGKGGPAMRFKKPIVALSTAGLLALAACGGSSGGGDTGKSDSGIDQENLGNTGDGKDPEAKGPVTIDGAKEGGTVTVLTSTGLTTPIDPTDLYYTDTNAVMTALVTRQLTQYKYDEDSGQMILVPDLATDLGTPNDDYTEWTFTLRDGIKWEDGSPVTPEEVMFGICRSMDAKTFPNGPGLYYSNPYFLGGDKYKGPYTEKDPNCEKQQAVSVDGNDITVKMSKPFPDFLGGDKYKGPYTEKDPNCEKQQAVSVDGNDITVKMSKPFPDFPYYASFPAIGPIPTGDASDPAQYARHPLATGPYKIKSYSVAKSLVLE